MLTGTAASYTLASFYVDRITSRFGHFNTMALSLAVCGFATALLGPLPGMKTNGQAGALVLLSFAFLVQGAAAAIAFIPTLPTMMESIEHLGPAATGAVAGSFYALFSAGQSVGPILGTAFVSAVGFRWYALILCLCLRLSVRVSLCVSLSLISCVCRAGGLLGLLVLVLSPAMLLGNSSLHMVLPILSPPGGERTISDVIQSPSASSAPLLSSQSPPLSPLNSPTAHTQTHTHTHTLASANSHASGTQTGTEKNSPATPPSRDLAREGSKRANTNASTLSPLHSTPKRHPISVRSPVIANGNTNGNTNTNTSTHTNGNTHTASPALSRSAVALSSTTSTSTPTKTTTLTLAASAASTNTNTNTNTTATAAASASASTAQTTDIDVSTDATLPPQAGRAVWSPSVKTATLTS